MCVTPSLSFGGATVTRDHNPGGFNTCLLLSSGGRKSEIREWAGLVSSEAGGAVPVPHLSASIWWFAGDPWRSLAILGVPWLIDASP